MPQMRKLRTDSGAVAAVLTAGLVLGSCGAGQGGEQHGEPGEVAGQITVFAAASLTDAFEEIEQGFVEQHPEAELVFNFAASSALAQQITRGAPADVFAAADEATMARVADAGDVAGVPAIFTANAVQIAVPPGNPAGVTELGDFADDELVTAICAEQVPCGAAAAQAFDAAGVEPAPASLEENARAVLTRVRLGEVDAGVVYRTDVLSADGAVDGIDVPEADVPEAEDAEAEDGEAEDGEAEDAEAEDARTEYPIAAMQRAPNEPGAQAFVDYVRSDAGQEVLADHGFGDS